MTAKLKSASQLLSCVLLVTPLVSAQTVPAPAPISQIEDSTLPAFLSTFIARTQANRNATLVPLSLNAAYNNTPNQASPSPAPAPAPEANSSTFPGFGYGFPETGRRHLLQGTVPVGDLSDIYWEGSFYIEDASGNIQGPFNADFDTGSNDLVLPGGSPPIYFDKTGLPIMPATPPGPIEQQYGTGTTEDTYGNFYSATYTFAGGTGAAARAIPSHALVANFRDANGNSLPGKGPSVFGLGFQYSKAQQYIKAQTPLVDFFNTANLDYRAFTYYLHEINPIPLGQLVPNQGQVGFGDSLPSLQNAAYGIDANAYFQNVDLACYPVASQPDFGTNWAVSISGITSQPGTSPLGPNDINFCTNAVCQGIVDTGTFDIRVRNSDLPLVYDSLGLGRAPRQYNDLQRGGAYPRIPCSARSRSTPTIDFRLSDRIYSLSPQDYIFEATPSGSSQSYCYVVIDSLGTNAFGQEIKTYILGAPFIAKYPATFFEQITLPPPFPAEETPDQRVCFYGTVPIVAKCNDPLPIPATANCQAHLTEEELLNLINGANKAVIHTSSPPSTDTTQFSVQPAPGSDGLYDLGVGSHELTLVASNSVSSSKCLATVVVTDQEPLSVDRLSCGTPTNGILEEPLLSKADPLAVYKPAGSKVNGCPVTTSVSSLVCQNCLLGPLLSDTITKCESTTDGTSVTIGKKQLARVTWTVTEKDSASSLSAKCSVCVQQDLLDKCPSPYTLNAPCRLGQY